VHDSPKVNVFLCCKQNTDLQTILFSEATITGHVYLDVLEHILVPQLDVKSVIWQQDEAFPHCHRDVIQYLIYTFPGRLISCGGYIL
jgi:hypothetical protein